MSNVLLETFFKRGMIGNEQTAWASGNPLARVDVVLVAVLNPCHKSTRAVLDPIIVQPGGWRELDQREP